MPLACSETGTSAASRFRPGRSAGRLLAPFWLVPLLLMPHLPAPEVAAQPRSAWLKGVFPVASFSGFTGGYGPRDGPGVAGDWHHGLDIAAPFGSPVRSWWSGTLIQVVDDGRCGKGLVIRSGEYEHIYCHLEGQVSARGYRSGPVLLAAGDRVRTGQTIGHVGTSGRTTGPHLHWGLRYRGQWLDPVRILRSMAESRRRTMDPRVGRLP